LFRGGANGRVRRSTDPRENEEQNDRHDSIIVCHICRQALTTAAARTAINGSHEHTFDNPHGIRFRIGCFAWVNNCSIVTPTSMYWSWFPGHAWQVEVCAGCGEHLGWLFKSVDKAFFHGLILDRLMELDQEPE
jgi:hypothetical protein